MGVQLNIKDAETVELAHALSRRLGKSLTETIRHALEREQAARDAEHAQVMQRVREISEAFRADLPPEWKGRTSKEIMDSIYDDDGLPI